MRVRGAESERYWDERARENALFYVDNELAYDDPDTEAFWQRGEDVVQLMLGMVDLEIRSTETVLDIGCGVGRLTRALATRAERVYGLDVSREMLRLARSQPAARERRMGAWRRGEPARDRGWLGRRLSLARRLPAHPGPRDHARLRARYGPGPAAGRVAIRKSPPGAPPGRLVGLAWREAASRSEANIANASIARNCARSTFSEPVTAFIALVIAAPPMRETDTPTSIAGRWLAANRSDCRKIARR